MKKVIHSAFCLALSTAACGSASLNTPTPTPDTHTPSYQGFIQGSFIYWYTKEDGLDVAESAVLTSIGATVLPSEGIVFQQNFSYDPGFKVAGGIMSDAWGLYTEYTWLRSSNTTSKSAPDNNLSIAGTGVWNLDDWFLQTTALGGSPTGTYLSSTYKLAFDIIDLLATNPIYEKKNILVSAEIGLRSVWIRQKMNLSLTQAADSVGANYLPAQPIFSLNHSHSWGIGPKMGLHTKFLLPQTFRIEGSLAASLLYTRFSSIKHYEDSISTLAIHSSGVIARIGSFSTVRPNMEANLGIGKEFRFYNKYLFDVSASYDFTLFWEQNVMRQMLDEYWIGTQASAGDIYLQGLTVNARFSF